MLIYDQKQKPWHADITFPEFEAVMASFMAGAEALTFFVSDPHSGRFRHMPASEVAMTLTFRKRDEVWPEEAGTDPNWKLSDSDAPHSMGD